MATYTSNYTGAQIDAALAKAASLPNVAGTLTADGLKIESTSNGVEILDSDAASASASDARILFQHGSSVETARIGMNSTTSSFQIGSDKAIDVDVISNDIKRIRIEDNGDISFYEDTGTTAKFFWDASAEYLGIGTATPAARLDLGAYSGGLLNTNILNAQDGWINVKTSSAVSGSRYEYGANGYYGRIYASASGFNLDTGTSAVPIIIGTNSTERMRIDSSGNVGIGTSNATPSNGEGMCIGSSDTITRIDMRNSTTGDATGDGTSLQLNGNNFTIENREAGYVAFATSLTERARIDSSGNLLVGTTNSTHHTGSTDQGITLSKTFHGLMSASRSGAQPLILNRQTNDGAIVDFRKDGTTVGSIGSVIGPKLYIASGDTGIRFDGASDLILPTDGSGGARNAAVSLGDSFTRFKNLYLSGGVYLGGTGAANLLDDYEEGTFDATLTPTTSGTISVASSLNGLQYTKIGRLVHVQGNIVVDAVLLPVGEIELNLPFAVSGMAEYGERTFTNVFIYDTVSNSASTIARTNDGAHTSIIIGYDASSVTALYQFRFNFSYIVA